MSDLWKDNSIQFPRLIAEIIANVNINEMEMRSLRESMDLSQAEVNELFDRAQEEWDEIYDCLGECGGNNEKRNTTKL